MREAGIEQLIFVTGRRFDCGSKTGFVEATLALERPDMADDARAIARCLLGDERGPG